MSCNQHDKIFLLGFKSTWLIPDKGTKPTEKLKYTKLCPTTTKVISKFHAFFSKSKHVQYDSISRKQSMIPKTDNRQYF